MSQGYGTRRWGAAIAVTLALSMTAGNVRAGDRSPAGPAGPAAPERVEDDGGTPEVGVEWITDWPGTADDRANWYYSANNLYNELRDGGWIGRFNYGNTNAWERDFKAAAYGGINDSVIDAVDLALIGTHGSSAWDPVWGKALSSVYFSSNNDDWHLSPGEAYRAYGNNDLEWLAFDSCSVLRDDSMGYWHESFDGLHLMLGFANTMYVVYPGDGGVWGDQMRQKGWWIFGHPARTVTQAWFTAVEDQQPSGVRARVLAEELDNYNDYIWGQGYVSADYPNNGGYWYWDHVAGTPAPLQIGRPPDNVLRYKVVSRTVDSTYVQMIGRSFGLITPTNIISSPDGSAFYMVGGISDTLQLKVNTASGGFFFQNLGELWTNPDLPRTLPPDGERAAGLATDFLTGNGTLPGIGDFITSGVTPTAELEGATDGPISPTFIIPTSPTSPTNFAIHYARTLDLGNLQKVSVVGPGSRLNVYIGDNDQVIGVKGGARMVVPFGPGPGRYAPRAGELITTPIKTAQEAWAAFLANPAIALAQPPLALTYVTQNKPEPTLAYYEQPAATGQDELIPVWLFVADLYTTTVAPDASGQSPAADIDVLVAKDAQIYVPASAVQSASPIAVIDAPAGGTQVLPGQPLNLTGHVAGGLAPYTFQWSSSADGPLGSGDTLDIPGLSYDVKGNTYAPNKILLTVIDANGQTDTAEVDVVVLLHRYLPVIRKE